MNAIKVLLVIVLPSLTRLASSGLLFLLLLISESIAQPTPVSGQAVYEVQPGTKSNEIKLTVANVSEANAANNVEIVLVRKSSSINFNKEIETIESIEAKDEVEAIFTFDVKRNAPVNKKDTIDFLITGANGLMMSKSFIFSYTGPKEFKLEQNFPNPFNPTTTIQYQVSGISEVTLKIFDILGGEVATLINEEQPGYYEVKFNAANFASGMYVYRLSAGNFVSVKKMMVLK